MSFYSVNKILTIGSLVIIAGVSGLVGAADASKMANDSLSGAQHRIAPSEVADEGCPYPPGTPAAVAEQDQQPMPSQPQQRSRPRPGNIVVPAIYVELFFPVDEADKPKIIV